MRNLMFALMLLTFSLDVFASEGRPCGKDLERFDKEVRNPFVESEFKLIEKLVPFYLSYIEEAEYAHKKLNEKRLKHNSLSVALRNTLSETVRETNFAQCTFGEPVRGEGAAQACVIPNYVKLLVWDRDFYGCDTRARLYLKGYGHEIDLRMFPVSDGSCEDFREKMYPMVHKVNRQRFYLETILKHFRTLEKEKVDGIEKKISSECKDRYPEFAVFLWAELEGYLINKIEHLAKFEYPPQEQVPLRNANR